MILDSISIAYNMLKNPRLYVFQKSCYDDVFLTER